MGFLLAIDQGTTGTTALLLDAKSLKILDKENQEYPQIYPKPGLVEHNLDDIWNSVGRSVTAIVKRQNIDPQKIDAIGITNQRETTCAYSKEGKPLHNAIVWQDRRTSEYCEKNASRYQEVCRKKTGLPLDPYFSGSKMRWFLDNVPAVQEAANNNDLCFNNR
jgi:glycerol kinase